MARARDVVARARDALLASHDWVTEKHVERLEKKLMEKKTPEDA